VARREQGRLQPRRSGKVGGVVGGTGGVGPILLPNAPLLHGPIRSGILNLCGGMSAVPALPSSKKESKP
jgi:hypothetical protein